MYKLINIGCWTKYVIFHVNNLNQIIYTNNNIIRRHINYDALYRANRIYESFHDVRKKMDSSIFLFCPMVLSDGVDE